MADKYSNAIYLSERDCTVQRQYQKIIEIAPAVFLSDAIRQKLHDAIRSQVFFGLLHGYY